MEGDGVRICRSRSAPAGIDPPPPGPVLVIGEQGAGKRATVHALHASDVAAGRLRTLDTRSLRIQDERAWMTYLRAVLSRPGGLTLVLHLDETPSRLEATVRAAMHTAVADGHRFYGTATTGPHLEARNPGLTGPSIVTVVSVPPVRERDVRGLITELTAQPSLATSRTWTPAAIEAMRTFDWPGNLRQLIGVLRGVAAGEGPIEADELPPEIALAPASRNQARLERAERNTIIATLREAAGNKSVAAAALGISRSSLYRTMAQHHIEG